MIQLIQRDFFSPDERARASPDRRMARQGSRSRIRKVARLFFLPCMQGPRPANPETGNFGNGSV